MLFKSSKNEGDSPSPNKRAKQTSASSRKNSTAASKKSTATPKKDAKKIAKKNDNIKKQTGKNLDKCLKPGKKAHEAEKQREEEARMDEERYLMGTLPPFKGDASGSGVKFVDGRKVLPNQ